MKRGAVVLVPALLCLVLGFVIGRCASDSGQVVPASHLALLTRDLSLQPQQVSALGALLAEQDKDLQRLYDDAQQRLREPTAARLQRTEDAMLALLDTEQRDTYQRLTNVSVDSRGR